MAITKTILLLGIFLLLFGCSCCNTPPPTKACPTSVTPPADDAEVQLAEAAASISRSLIDLNAMEKAVMPPINCKCLSCPPCTDPCSNCLCCSDLCEIVSVDWAGPIEPLLRRLACMLCGYRLHVIGPRPAIPVLVTISARNTPIGYIIRDANFQAASKACVAVYPELHVIELRYGRI